MTEKKVTKREMFGKIAEICGKYPEIVEFCNHEVDLLNKKNSKSTTSKTQVENEKVVEVLINELANIGTPITISDLMTQSEVVKNYVLDNGNHLSNQKISALLNAEVGKRVVKVTDKKKSFFSIA